jgi:dTMP kinase
MTGKGFFISIEGGEKTGKTTQAGLLAKWLSQRGIETVLTREPGGTPAGEAIREILLNAAKGSLTPVTEALLFASSRGQLVAEVIRPALEAGKTVVADRYVDSSLAYQSFGLGLPLDQVRAVNDLATGGLRPDLTVLLDGPDLDGFLARSRSGEADRIEKRQEEFHRRVAEGYRELARRSPARFVVIDASTGVEEVSKAIRAAVQRLYGWK